MERACSFVQANEKNKFHYTVSAFSLTKSHFASSELVTARFVGSLTFDSTLACEERITYMLKRKDNFSISIESAAYRSQ